MSELTLRAWRPEDIPALKSLWKIGFGDDDETIERFYSEYLKPGMCIAAETDGKLVSAMYIIPGETLQLLRRETITAGYTYALATLPEYRGRGVGSAVYRACCDAILETADAACVLPAEAALYPMYERANGARPISAAREARIEKAELTGITPRMATRFPGFRYGALRENLMIGLPHATFDEDFYTYMEDSGMEFFMLENGLAAAETIDGVCHIRELIDTARDPMTALAAVARWCPAKEYVVRSPLFFDGPGEAKPQVLGVLKRNPGSSLPDDLWWGFGLE